MCHQAHNPLISASTALDATSALPLTNSLSHLAYLTSTSPRIREILTVDGGLECLVRLLLDFCNSPPPPVNPRQFYGLLPPGQSIKRQPLVPGRWQPFDRAAASRFSLAFKCVVNVGVRGSENIRSRVVQAGMLSVVGSVLEQWLLSKGFAVVPSSTGSGAPRENRQARLARRQELERRQMQQQQQAQLAEVSQVLQRQTSVPAISASSSTSSTFATTVSAEEDNSVSAGGPSTEEEEGEVILVPRTRREGHGPHGATTSNQSLPSRPSSSSSELFSDQTSGVSTPTRAITPTTEPEPESDEQPPRERSGTIRARPGPSQASTSRTANGTRRTSGRRQARSRGSDVDDTEADEMEETRPVAGVAGMEPQAAIAVVDESRGEGMTFFGAGGMSDFEMTGVEVDRAMVNLAGDDALAMGAPPGAPGAAVAAPTGTTPRPSVVDVTPRPAITALNDDSSAMDIAAALDGVDAARGARVILQNLAAAGDGERVFNLQDRQAIVAGAGAGGDALVRTILAQTPELRLNGAPSTRSSTSTVSQQGPFQDEDVLLSLQLLAYLSKYPYVRQAFYQPRKSLATPSDPTQPHAPEDDNGSGNPRSPNIFSLVERFTFRPSPSEPHLPRLPQEIQYWAGVIMRNACRKDESRGGIRQCASMTCGKWETYPREFAKCRRCRKAKYCGKECQSRAWAEGHRFWCNVRETEEEAGANPAVDPLTNLPESYVLITMFLFPD